MSKQQRVQATPPIQVGLEHHRAGRLAQAEGIYRQVLGIQPNNVDALNLLGTIAAQVGNYTAAVELIDRALLVKPNYAEALLNRGFVLQALKRNEEALASYDRALSIKPNYVEALGNRAAALQALERHEEALASCDKALSIKSDYAEAWGTRAAALQALARHEEALASYDKALATKPHHAEMLSSRGAVLQALNRHEEALASCDNALSIIPNYAEALNNRGAALQALARHEEALASCDKALWIKPNFAEALSIRAAALQALKRHEEALASCDKALAIKPDFAEALHIRVAVLEALDRDEEALADCDKALLIDPQDAETRYSAGLIYLEMGKLNEARASFEETVARRPDLFEAHLNLSLVKKYTRDDPHLAMLEQAYSARTALPDHARINYCFALGKALEDIGEYDRAFAAYEEGNRLKHALVPMDERKDDELLEGNLAVFDERFFAERRDWRGASDPQRTPIFIVGTPRSGTTLLEQILSSHASVHGAGELRDLRETLVSMTPSGHQRPYPYRVAAYSEADLKRIGHEYIERVWKRSPESAFITDKMPANFLYLGLIHLALPNAKIIHAMRDPMDSCFSCYSLLFKEPFPGGYDLGTLGRQYVRYSKLMAHWHKVLPAGSILDLPYEKMVEDTEGQARRVLEFVGLPWDENCLKFHENTRVVKTASWVQVRNPIYKSSVARWKHFGRHLLPLLRIVRDYRSMDAEDLALMEG